CRARREVHGFYEVPRRNPPRWTQAARGRAMSTDYAKVLGVLTGSNVEFLLIGGVAANLHGSARATFDVDVVYSRKKANIANLVKALAPYAPYLRGAPPGLPFKFDETTVRNGLNFTLETTLGDVDVLGEV